MSHPAGPIGELVRRLRMMFQRRQLDRDLEEEMRLHLDLRRQQQIESGLSLAAASQAAHRKFGYDGRAALAGVRHWRQYGHL
jgi:hypothetical protein